MSLLNFSRKIYNIKVDLNSGLKCIPDITNIELMEICSSTCYVPILYIYDPDRVIGLVLNLKSVDEAACLFNKDGVSVYKKLRSDCKILLPRFDPVSLEPYPLSMTFKVSRFAICPY